MCGNKHTCLAHYVLGSRHELLVLPSGSHLGVFDASPSIIVKLRLPLLNNLQLRGLGHPFELLHVRQEGLVPRGARLALDVASLFIG